MRYGKLGAASIHPLHAALQLPARTFYYELSGVTVPKRSLEEVIQDAAQDFDAFYAARPRELGTETGRILVAALDGNGIPLVKRRGASRVVLKRRHGLDRCFYKGDEGMKRWVGLGVIADNLINIGRNLATRDTS